MLPLVRGHQSALRQAAATLATSGGSQVFLGARWIPALIRVMPQGKRRAVALWLLSLSPHYFFDSDREGEARRNQQSRAELADDLLGPHLTPSMAVLDYGCGPGYMALAVSRRVRRVEAVDISCGVLACARILNGAPNIVYEPLSHAVSAIGSVDVVYSFAVIQHVTDARARRDLSLLRSRLRDGGKLLVHFAAASSLPTEEEQWSHPRPLSTIRSRLALDVFGRDAEQMRRVLEGAGFTDIRFERLRDKTSSPDDIAGDQWAIATAPAGHQQVE